MWQYIQFEPICCGPCNFNLKVLKFSAVTGYTSVDKNPCYSGTDYSGTTQSPPLKPQL